MLLLVIGAAIVSLAALAIWWAGRLREESGVPSGRITHTDTYGGLPEIPGKPLFSATYGLTGAPDYIVSTREGTVPVEVKPGRTETEPHESHLLQVLAYCLLLEDKEG